jgi:hypothetical protein
MPSSVVALVFINFRKFSSCKRFGKKLVLGGRYGFSFVVENFCVFNGCSEI